MADEKRFIDLEMKISHQEYQLEQLSETIYRQQQQMDQLEKKLTLLKQKLEAPQQTLDIGPANDKPPHY